MNPTNTSSTQNTDVAEVSPLDYFNSLIKKRAFLVDRWEYFNKAYNISNDIQDRDKMVEFGTKLDKIEDQIAKMAKDKGLIDPDCMPNSPTESE